VLTSRVDLPDTFFFPVVDKEFLYTLWELIEGNEWIFTSDEGEGAFLQHFLNRAELTIAGKGIVITVTDIHRGHVASLHGFIHSKAVFSYLDDFPKLAFWLLMSLPVNRLEVRVPKRFHGLRKFLEKINLKEEGILRKYRNHSKMREDMVLYSFIEEDFYELS
jgi:hypothetical protein